MNGFVQLAFPKLFFPSEPGGSLNQAACVLPCPPAPRGAARSGCSQDLLLEVCWFCMPSPCQGCSENPLSSANAYLNQNEDQVPICVYPDVSCCSCCALCSAVSKMLSCLSASSSYTWKQGMVSLETYSRLFRKREINSVYKTACF